MSFEEMDTMEQQKARAEKRQHWIEFLLDDAQKLAATYSEYEEVEETTNYPRTSEELKALREQIREHIAAVRYDLGIIAKYEGTMEA